MASSPAQVAIHALDPGDAAALSELYQHVLLPNFPAAELESESNLADGLLGGGTLILLARGPDGSVLGGVVGDWFAGSQVLLLSYVAVRPGLRGGGVGTKLLAAAAETWIEQLRPRLYIGEVEDPRFHHETAFGDPVARVRLYERLGVRTLPLPYFQPALGPEGSRVPHLMLMVFGGVEAPPGTERVDGRIVERFLIEYLETCEGQVRPDDAETQHLLAACRREGGLPLLLTRDLPDLEPTTR